VDGGCGAYAIADPSVDPGATLNQYCVSCHNERSRIGAWRSIPPTSARKLTGADA